MYADLRTIADYLIDRLTPRFSCSEVYHMTVKKAAILDVCHMFMNIGKGRKSLPFGHGAGLHPKLP